MKKRLWGEGREFTLFSWCIECVVCSAECGSTEVVRDSLLKGGERELTGQDKQVPKSHLRFHHHTIQLHSQPQSAA